MVVGRSVRDRLVGVERVVKLYFGCVCACVKAVRIEKERIEMRVCW